MVDETQGNGASKADLRHSQDVLVDPGIEIIIAIVGFVGGAIAIVDKVDKNFNQLPSKVREKILNDILDLQDDLRFIQTELKHIEQVFSRSHNPSSVLIRLGNGYLMPKADFEEYARINKGLMARLRSLSKHIFSLERRLIDVTEVDRMEVGGHVSRAREILGPILTTQDLTLPDARARLHDVIEETSSLCFGILKRIK